MGRCDLGPNSVNANCRCDPDCIQFNDCCFDHDICQHGQHKFNKSAIPIDFFSCIPLEEGIHGIEQMFGTVRIVSKCPSDWIDETVRRLCERHLGDESLRGESPNVASLFKWHVFDDIGNNFKNAFCAICNGKNILEVQPWAILATPYSEANQDITCIKANYEIERTVGSRLRLCHDIVDSCPESYINESLVNQNVSDQCQSYSATICLTDVIYKNYACGLCNGLDESAQVKPCDMLTNRANYHSTPVFNTLWKFKRDRDTQTNNETLTCDSKHQVFDPFQRQCVFVTCSPGSIYDTSTEMCTKSPKLPNAFHGMCCSKQQSWFVYTNDVRLTDEVSNDRHDRECLKNHLLNSSLFLGANVTNLEEYKLTKISSTKVLLAAHDSVCNVGNILDDVILKSVDFYDKCKKDVIEYMHVCQKAGRVSHHECNELWYSGESDEFALVELAPSVEVFLYRNEYILPKLVIDYISYEYHLFDLIYHKNETVLVCGKMIQLLDCPVLVLRGDEYRITEGQRMIVTVNMQNHTLEEDDYVMLPDDRAQICAHQVEKYFKSTIFDYTGILDAVNIIGCSLSLAGLAVLFLIHCVFSELRHFHGRSVMCYCVAMFWAQLIPLLTVKLAFTARICVFLAILSHTSWLAAFTWMTIITADMTYILVCRPMQRPANLEDTPVYRYLLPLIGWGVPLILVSLCTTFHLSGAFGFEYGNIAPCWISGPEANLVAFGIPVGVCQAFNTVCYIVCMASVCRNQRRSRLLRGNARTIFSLRDVILSMKVSTWSSLLEF